MSHRIPVSVLLIASLGACAPQGDARDDARVAHGESALDPGPQPLGFDFEDGTTEGWGVGWGSAFDPSASPAVEASSAIATPGNTTALALHVAFTNASWEEADAQAYLRAPGEAVDLSVYDRLEYDLYVPSPDALAGALRIGTAANAPWGELAPWSSVDLASAPRVVRGTTTYARVHVVVGHDALVAAPRSEQLVVRVAASGATFVGALFVDDVRFVSPSGAQVAILTPSPLDTVTGAVTVTARVTVPSGSAAPDVALVTPEGSRLPMTPTTPDEWVAAWDTSATPDGVATLQVTARAADATVSRDVEVLVKSSGIDVRLDAPAFDATLAGLARVRATVTRAANGPIDEVRARLGDLDLPMRPRGGGEYDALVDTRRLDDGAFTLVVTARAGANVAREWTDVMVTNARREPFVTRAGSELVAGGKAFAYVGFNAYDLPFVDDRTLRANEKAITYGRDGTALARVLPKGTRLTFEALVDRRMLEARKLGLTVVRTWAFNDATDDPHAFYTKSWEPNEAELRRLDYVVDSARRHGIAVILTLENYWGDYGGIGAIAGRFGVPKLAFFTDPACQAAYRAHVERIVTRTSTRNGRVYRDDPTIFAWELMNEPRMDAADDTTADKHLYDPDGARLGAWLEDTARYVKQLDPRHLVSTGAEGHGFGGWGRTDEGYGDDPLAVMDRPSIDLFTFHPYLNASWSRLPIGQAKKLVTDFVHAGLARGKPVLMEEWGFDKRAPVLDRVGTPVAPDDPRYDAVRAAWYRFVASTFRREGGSGSNVWMLETDDRDPSFGIALSTPARLVTRDHPLTRALEDEAGRMKALGGADFLWDVRWRYTDFDGYIYEVANDGIMPRAFEHFFFPSRVISEGELGDIFGRLGIDVTALDLVPNAPLTMERAGTLVYAALHLDAYGAKDEALAKLDLVPRDRRGRYAPAEWVSKGTMAALVVRIRDFLLFP